MPQNQLRLVLESYVERDSAKADSVWSGDAEIDAAHSSVVRDLLTHMVEESSQHRLLCASSVLLQELGANWRSHDEHRRVCTLHGNRASLGWRPAEGRRCEFRSSAPTGREQGIVRPSLTRNLSILSGDRRSVRDPICNLDRDLVRVCFSAAAAAQNLGGLS